MKTHTSKKGQLSKWFLVFSILVLFSLTTSCDHDDTHKSDLIVSEITITGDVVMNTENNLFEVPIRVVVRNQGETEADIFKVAIEYIIPPGGSYIPGGGTFVTSFSVPGETDIFYPRSDVPLPSDSEVSFSGVAHFRTEMEGSTITIYATADSCSGEEFTESYCRVDESDETNNSSIEVALSL